jgi:hypothetical protein
MSIDQFAISTPESPSYKGILWRRSIVRHLKNLRRKGGFKGFNLERRIARSGRSFISF